MQMQADLGIFLAERPDHLRQHVACLGMSGRDGQGAAVGLAQLRRGAAYVLHLTQNARGSRNDLITRRGGARQSAALALEQLESEFLFQHLELAAHARLGGV